VIGTDASREMLEEAQQNLRRTGIEARLELDASRVKNQRGVVLVQDDLLGSKLPDALVDVALFAFPELGTECKPKAIDRYLMKVYEAVFGRLDDDLKIEAAISLRADHHIARLTKKGGLTLFAVYDTSRGALSEEERQEVAMEAKRLGIINLQYVDNSFVPSFRVWADTEQAKLDRIMQVPIIGNRLAKGFRIYKLKKRSE